MSGKRAWVLDTETTGLSWENGDRLIEVGMIELIDREPTGRVFHEYVDPERDVPMEAVDVHGLTLEDLIEKGNGQKFSDIAERFLECIRDSVLIIHNASFDMGFLDFELRRLGLPEASKVCSGVHDTLAEANRKYPRQKNNLDALCNRFGINNKHRELHGALLDSEILYDVYRFLTQDQKTLVLDEEVESDHKARSGKRMDIERVEVSENINSRLKSAFVSKEDDERHNRFLKIIAKESGDEQLSWP